MSGERNSGKSHSKSLYALRVCTKQLNKGGIYRTMEPIIIPKLVHNSLFYIIVSTANEQKITQPHAAICSKFQVINSTLYFESQINKRVATANGKRICTQCTYTMHLHMASAPKIEIAHFVFFFFCGWSNNLVCLLLLLSTSLINMLKKCVEANESPPNFVCRFI